MSIFNRSQSGYLAGIFLLLLSSDFLYPNDSQYHKALSDRFQNENIINEDLTNQKRVDQEGVAQNGLDQKKSAQNGLDQNESAQNGLDQNESAQNGLDLKIAFDWLIKDQPLKAIEIFDQLDLSSPEVLAGRAFSSYQLKSWGEALKIVNSLPESYKQLDGFRGIAIQSMAAMGDIEGAERGLRGLLSSPLESSTDQFSSEFQYFKEKKLDQLNRYFVAAIFFNQVKGDKKKSLEYLNQIDDPSLISEMEKAKILLDLGRPNEAKRILTELKESLQASKKGSIKNRAINQSRINYQLLPLLAATDIRLGYFPDAASYYSDFFSFYPIDLSYRSDYANVLSKIRRYDLAENEYGVLLQANALLNEDRFAYIRSLVFQNKFKEADRRVQEWLEEEDLSLLSLLQLGRLMILTQNKEFVGGVLSQVAKSEKKTAKERLALVQFYIDLAKYEEALALISVNKAEFDGTANGLLVQAQLFSKLSQNEQARQAAEKASVLDPGNNEVFEFLKRYARRSKAIEDSINLSKEKIMEEPNNISLQIDMATDLIDLAIGKVGVSGIVDGSQVGADLMGADVSQSLKNSPQLEEVRVRLEELIHRNKDNGNDKDKDKDKDSKIDLPVVYFLLGKVYYLLDRNQEALDTLNRAVSLDPSYVEAYQMIALIYEDQKKYAKAIEALYAAARFAPNQAELWEQLAETYLKIDDVSGAIEALMTAIRYSPRDSDIYVQLASLYLRIKKPEDAVLYLEKALKLSPKNIEAIKLMLVTLYDPDYLVNVDNPKSLLKKKMAYFDKLQALDPKEAAAMRTRFGLAPDGF